MIGIASCGIIALLLSQVHCGGVLDVWLMTYGNPSGAPAMETCCDYMPGSQQCEDNGGCDHYLLGCFARGKIVRFPDSCDIGSFQTAVYNNSKHINFGSTIGNSPNPMSIPFVYWQPEGVLLKVYVLDEDWAHSKDDLVDTLQLTLRLPTARDKQTATYHDIHMRGLRHTEFHVKIRVYCSANYYGPECDVYCRPEDSDTRGHYDCELQTGNKLCKPGWSGSRCTVAMQFCSSMPCINGGSCRHTHDGYLCTCQHGYAGVHCERIVDTCWSAPCKNGAICHPVANYYYCQCTMDYEGRNCDTLRNHCAGSPCLHGATCTSRMGYHCACTAGWTGYRCETTIDECASDPCMNGATCTDQHGAYKCDCCIGYTGVRCEVDIDDCASVPCVGSGSLCEDGEAGYVCVCEEGRTGVMCETDIEECSSMPCNNGGTCVDAINSYSCVCADGWEGLHCEENVDECASQPCQNNQTCVDGINSYSCECSAAWRGAHCDEDVDECHAWTVPGENVTDTQPCRNNGTCVNTYGAFTCHCVNGYEGELCEEESNECDNQPCYNGATCIDMLADYRCVCSAHFTGRTCDVKYDVCTDVTCSAGATCVMNATDAVCRCPAGVTGPRCDGDIDECLKNHTTASDEEHPCENGGVCHNHHGGYSCVCHHGYEGDRCQTLLQNNTELHENMTTHTMIAEGSSLVRPPYTQQQNITDVHENNMDLPQNITDLHQNITDLHQNKTELHQNVPTHAMIPAGSSRVRLPYTQQQNHTEIHQNLPTDITEPQQNVTENTNAAGGTVALLFRGSMRSEDVAALKTDVLHTLKTMFQLVPLMQITTYTCYTESGEELTAVTLTQENPRDAGKDREDGVDGVRDMVTLRHFQAVFDALYQHGGFSHVLYEGSSCSPGTPLYESALHAAPLGSVMKWFMLVTVMLIFTSIILFTIILVTRRPCSTIGKKQLKPNDGMELQNKANEVVAGNGVSTKPSTRSFTRPVMASSNGSYPHVTSPEREYNPHVTSPERGYNQSVTSSPRDYAYAVTSPVRCYRNLAMPSARGYDNPAMSLDDRIDNTTISLDDHNPVMRTHGQDNNLKEQPEDNEDDYLTPVIHESDHYLQPTQTDPHNNLPSAHPAYLQPKRNEPYDRSPSAKPDAQSDNDYMYFNENGDCKEDDYYEDVYEYITPEMTGYGEYLTTMVCNGNQHKCSPPPPANTEYGKQHKCSPPPTANTEYGKQHKCSSPPPANTEYGRQHKCSAPPPAQNVTMETEYNRYSADSDLTYQNQLYDAIE